MSLLSLSHSLSCHLFKVMSPLLCLNKLNRILKAIWRESHRWTGCIEEITINPLLSVRRREVTKEDNRDAQLGSHWDTKDTVKGWFSLVKLPFLAQIKNILYCFHCYELHTDHVKLLYSPVSQNKCTDVVQKTQMDRISVLNYHCTDFYQ